MAAFRIAGTRMNHCGLLLALSLVALPALAQSSGQAATVETAVAETNAAVPAPETVPAAAPAAVTDARGEAPVVAAGADPDPWEGFNRAVFSFNDRLDRYALKPVAKGYKKVTPRPLRTGITNFFANLRMPIVLLNDLLQGKVRAAGSDGARFFVNSTLGFAGFVDASTVLGIARNDEDFGQTLGVWGVSSGPYLVLPFLGPSSARDSVGFAADVGTSPDTYVLADELNVGLAAVNVVNLRASLLEVEHIVQGDRYLFLRDLYLQRREFSVQDGRIESDPFLDDEEAFDEPGAQADEAAPEAGTPGGGLDAGPVGAAPSEPEPGAGISEPEPVPLDPSE